MRFRAFVLTALSLAAGALPARAQNINDQTLDQFLKGVTAERAELDKVGTQLADIDAKIAKFRECAGLLTEAGGGKTGLAAKIAMKAKCGATSEDSFQKDRARLLAAPEKIGAQLAGMKPGDYAELKERVTAFLNGNRSFSAPELKALNARADAFSKALGIALAKASEDNPSGGRGGIGSRLGNAIGNRMGAAFTPDMTWAYVGYLWGLMYMSGATMFETAYQPGQWTQWTIMDEKDKDNGMVLERALLSRQADGSEWWRIKTVSMSGESRDTIILESLFKKMDKDGMMMQVVRMRGKLPGDTEGKELMVPQQMSMLSTSAFPFKPTAESVAGATVGTEPIKVGGTSYLAKHVKFGTAGGSMEWWLADKAPGGVVRVQYLGQDKDQKWTMDMTASGTGAKSELGVK